MRKTGMIMGMMALIVHLIARGGLGLLILGILLVAVLTPRLAE